MHSVHIDAGLEQLGVPRQAHRGQIAAVRSAPQSDACAIDVAAPAKPLRRRDDITILAATSGSLTQRLAKLHAVSDAAAIVERHHDVAAQRERLIHRVGMVIIAAVVPAEQHLTTRTAMHEDDGRVFVARLRARRHEELPVRRYAVSCTKRHWCRRHEC